MLRFSSSIICCVKQKSVKIPLTDSRSPQQVIEIPQLWAARSYSYEQTGQTEGWCKII